MAKDVIILGSTGSIGVSSLKVIREFKEDFHVKGLACWSNIKVLKEQIFEFRPEFVGLGNIEIYDTEEYRQLKKIFTSVKFIEGITSVEDLASETSDILISAIVGSPGLRPNLKALDSTKRLALANKETLVMAGDIFMKLAKEKGVELIPVDSEHSAIFSLLENVKKSDLARVIITASGGSLRDVPIEEIPNVTLEQTLAHPTWAMGNKITIDSATLMNKGFEVIEAHHLFDLDYDKIDVVIHPESVVHSMIELKDGAVYAHMGVTNMTLPILNSLKYPEKVKNSFGHLDFTTLGQLTFRKYEPKKFPALNLCYEVGKAGGSLPAVLNSANEIAVIAFLKEQIGFMDIARIVETTVEHHNNIKNPSLEDIFYADEETRHFALTLI